MNISGWEDPQLKPTLQKVMLYLRNNYVRDPYLQRMFDHRAKGMMQHVPMAAHLHALDEAKTLKRKYNGEFYFGDFWAANKLRLLALNLGEFAAMKSNLLSHELRSFSRNFWRGPVQGYALNTAAYFGIYGHAGYQAGHSDAKFVTFMITTFFSAMALSPLQYLAARNWNNYNMGLEPPKDIKLDRGVPMVRTPLFIRNAALSYQRFFCFMPMSVLFSTLFGLSVYMHNVDNRLLNLLYYPALLITHTSLSLSGALNKFLQAENTFTGLRRTAVPNKLYVNFPSMALFFALNALLPLKIDQLRGADEFKHAYLEFVSDNEEFKGVESIYA